MLLPANVPVRGAGTSFVLSNATGRMDRQLSGEGCGQRAEGRGQRAECRGVLTVGGTVHDYIKHVDDHLKFLAEKRIRLGKPL